MHKKMNSLKRKMKTLEGLHAVSVRTNFVCYRQVDKEVCYWHTSQVCLQCQCVALFKSNSTEKITQRKLCALTLSSILAICSRHTLLSPCLQPRTSSSSCREELICIKSRLLFCTLFPLQCVKDNPLAASHSVLHSLSLSFA